MGPPLHPSITLNLLVTIVRSVIIEPHGDDALISCWPLFTCPEYMHHRLEVWTVATSRSSEGLRNHFSNVVATDYGDCWDLTPKIAKCINYNKYKRWMQNRIFPDVRPEPWWWQQVEQGVYAGEYWLECKDLADLWLRRKLNTLKRGDVVFAPIGLVHPQHILVGSLCEQMSRDYPHLLWQFYVEFPYASPAWVRDLWASHPGCEQSTGRIVAYHESILHEEKERIFRDVYPSEVKIFRFTYNEVIRNTCLLALQSAPNIRTRFTSTS